MEEKVPKFSRLRRAWKAPTARPNLEIIRRGPSRAMDGDGERLGVSRRPATGANLPRAPPPSSIIDWLECAYTCQILARRAGVVRRCLLECTAWVLLLGWALRAVDLSRSRWSSAVGR